MSNIIVAKGDEHILEPELPIIDAHHHLWESPIMPGWAPMSTADLASGFKAGHKIIGSVFVECHAGYRTEGPEEMRPVGETEYVVDRMTHLAPPDLQSIMCAGIVGFADLRRGDRVQPVLEAHIAAAKRRFRGIRYGGLS